MRLNQFTKSSIFKKVGIIVLRTTALFITFGLISVVSRLIFKSNLFEEVISSKAIGIWNSVFLFLIFESTDFVFNKNAVQSQLAFLESYTEGQWFGKIKSVFSSLDFYVEYFCIVLLSLIFPLSFVYDCVGVAFFQADYGKIQVMLVILPILLVLEICAHLSVRQSWVSDRMRMKKQKEKNEFFSTVKGIITISIVYCAASLVIPWGMPFFVSLSNLGAGSIVFLYIFIALLAAVLFVIATFYARAVKKRKSFIAKLKKYCGQHSITLSKVQKPYLSLFFQQNGADFTLKYNNVLYDCKLVAGVFPGSPIIFSDNGEGIRQNTFRLFQIEMFQLNTRIDYSMESRPDSCKKIIIVLPVPKNIYVSVQGSSPRSADTGEKIGQYTLYNATGFLNALERGHL